MTARLEVHQVGRERGLVVGERGVDLERARTDALDLGPGHRPRHGLLVHRHGLAVEIGRVIQKLILARKESAWVAPSCACSRVIRLWRSRIWPLPLSGIDTFHIRNSND